MCIHFGKYGALRISTFLSRTRPSKGGAATCVSASMASPIDFCRLLVMVGAAFDEDATDPFDFLLFVSGVSKRSASSNFVACMRISACIACRYRCMELLFLLLVTVDAAFAEDAMDPSDFLLFASGVSHTFASSNSSKYCNVCGNVHACSCRCMYLRVVGTTTDICIHLYVYRCYMCGETNAKESQTQRRISQRASNKSSICVTNNNCMSVCCGNSARRRQTCSATVGNPNCTAASPSRQDKCMCCIFLATVKGVCADS